MCVSVRGKDKLTLVDQRSSDDRLSLGQQERYARDAQGELDDIVQPLPGKGHLLKDGADLDGREGAKAAGEAGRAVRSLEDWEGIAGCPAAAATSRGECRGVDQPPRAVHGRWPRELGWVVHALELPDSPAVGLGVRANPSMLAAGSVGRGQEEGREMHITAACYSRRAEACSSPVYLVPVLSARAGTPVQPCT